jgi:hypothetical protein
MLGGGGSHLDELVNVFNRKCAKFKRAHRAGYPFARGGRNVSARAEEEGVGRLREG